MRPWVLLKHFGIPFEEVMVFLNQGDTRERILKYSPSGRVPALIDDGGNVIWDSLAIAETLAERFPQHGLWPSDPVARAFARSISAEMHSGFADVRQTMPMNIKISRPDIGRRGEVRESVARIDELWRQSLAKSGGPFLFGEFCIADAMYTPIAMRFNSYQPGGLSAESLAYIERIKALPAVAEWIEGSKGEPAIEYYDAIA
jgi:glutathione S-transferase